MQILKSSRGLRTTFVLAAFAAVAFAAASPVSSSSKTIGFDVTKNGAIETTDWSHLVSVPKFDATLGTLTAVSFTFDWSASLKGSVTSTGADMGTFQPTHTVDLYVSDVDPLLASNTPNFYGMGNLVTQSYGEVGLTQGKSQAFSFDGTGTGVGVDFDQAYLGLFTGQDDPGLWFWANGYFTENASGSFESSNDTKVGMKGYVTYTYDAVPEPTSMAALGLGAFGVLRRRKVSK